MTSPGPVAPGVFPPEQQALTKAVACELPARRGLPLSRLSVDEICQKLTDQGIASSMSRLDGLALAAPGRPAAVDAASHGPKYRLLINTELFDAH